MKNLLKGMAAIAAVITVLILTGCSNPGDTKKEDTPVTFISLTADESPVFTAENGSSAVITTKLTLTFDKDITDLNTTDIQLSSSTGTTKGNLTRTGTGIYELAVTGITNNGNVYVSISKPGYNITATSINKDENAVKTVTVYCIPLLTAGVAKSVEGEVTQWFKYTAIADIQYLCIARSFRHNGMSTNVYLYNSNSTKFESSMSCPYQWGNDHQALTLTSGQEYYVMVSQRDCENYDDKSVIMFDAVPSLLASELTANTWKSISLATWNHYERWYWFTATGSTQFLHLINDTRVGIGIEAYYPNGTHIEFNPRVVANEYASLTLTKGQKYYLLIYSYTNVSGMIAFNESSTPP